MPRFFSVLATCFLFLVGTAMPPLMHASDDPIEKPKSAPPAQADGPAGKTAPKSGARTPTLSPLRSWRRLSSKRRKTTKAWRLGSKLSGRAMPTSRS